MKPSFIVLSALAALATANPMERRQCAGCEPPAGKGNSASNPNVNSSSNASNSNSNSVNVVNQLPGGTAPGGTAPGGSTPSGTPPGGNGNVKPRCQDCLNFCGEHGDLGNALCKIFACGIVCVGV
ncbi:uncharacterized protein E0L32_000680 [Thyridium curvatum]|uniref:Uncharacterized protein n=1 Tax=Thyridium curvatum TaxID=1093900 RepID=A0A507AXZ0_9PEZI|nr:uncharacterized protein E0L32_000680 [Thyridium curvatum]TPX12503.1 hypothetical protein E0L32_000680 [Thyridium curvatum]